MKLKHLFEKSFAEEKGLTKTSIGLGYCEKDKKWYGYSHRAACGFGIGDMIYDENYGDDKTPYTKHGDKPCKTEADCKLAAQRFADSVS